MDQLCQCWLLSKDPVRRRQLQLEQDLNVCTSWQLRLFRQDFIFVTPNNGITLPIERKPWKKQVYNFLIVATFGWNNWSSVVKGDYFRHIIADDRVDNVNSEKTGDDVIVPSHYFEHPSRWYYLSMDVTSSWSMTSSWEIVEAHVQWRQHGWIGSVRHYPTSKVRPSIILALLTEEN
jgi:hypothetical protein